MPTHEPIVYCIGRGSRYSYAGWSNNFPHRIRQHNDEIKGGAVYTSKRTPTDTESDKKWSPRFIVYGFPSRSEAMSLEKHLHIKGTKVPDSHRRARNVFGKSAAGGRAWSVYWLLQRERFAKRTKTCDMQLTIYWRKRELYKAATKKCPVPWPKNVVHTRKKPVFLQKKRSKKNILFKAA